MLVTLVIVRSIHFDCRLTHEHFYLIIVSNRRGVVLVQAVTVGCIGDNHDAACEIQSPPQWLIIVRATVSCRPFFRSLIAVGLVLFTFLFSVFLFELCS